MEALPEVETYRDPLSIPLPDDPRQYPHPESEQWNDPDWRAEWLDGLTDDELNQMTPREKGQRLKAYAFGSGYSTYGINAHHYTVACDFFGRVGLSPLPAPQMFAIGAELTKGNYGHATL